MRTNDDQTDSKVIGWLKENFEFTSYFTDKEFLFRVTITLIIFCTLMIAMMIPKIFAQVQPSGENYRLIGNETMVSCKLTNAGGENYLTWSVLKENMAGIFILERSEEGNSFQYLGMVRGIPSDIAQPLMYSFKNPMPLYGLNFYRIRKFNYNHTMYFGPIVSAENHEIPSCHLESMN